MNRHKHHRFFVLLILISAMLLNGRVLASPPKQGAPIAIVYGQTVQGEISAEVPVMRFSFEGRVGETITASVDSTDFDAYITFSNEAGTLISSDDNSGDSGNPLLTATLEGGGTFLLNVSRSPIAIEDTVGQFTLTLEGGVVISTPISSPSGIDNESTTITTDDRLQNIRLNSQITGSFTNEKNFFVYWFDGKANQQIAIQPDITAEINPLLVLYRSDLSEIVRAQPGDRLNVTLDNEDVYFLIAASLDIGTVGLFSFEVIDETPLDTSALGEDAMIYGQSRSGAISNSAPLGRFRFYGNAGDTITLNMSRTDGDLDSFLLLVDSSGVTVAEDDNSGAINGDASLTTALPSTGEYFVIASRRGQDAGFTQGSYSLDLTSDAPPVVPEANTPTLPGDYVGLPQIQYGQTIRGEISNEGFLNIWVFYGQAGDNVTMTMEATDSQLDPLMILLDQNRIPLIENDDIVEGVQRDSQIDYTLENDGYYAIVATRFDQAEGTSLGTYSLSLNLDGASASALNIPLADRFDAQALTAGQTPSGAFAPLEMATVYTFPAAESQLIDFSVTADGGNTATLILTDSNLSMIADSDNGILLAISAPRNDDYFVFVFPQEGPILNIDANFFVALNVEIDDGSDSAVALGAPVPIAYGNVVSGEITEGRPEQRYVFQGRNGDVVEILMEAVGSSSVDSFLRLLGPDGETLVENDDIDPGVIRNSRIRTTLSTDGQYTIEATRYSGSDATPTVGDFTLTLTSQDPTTVGVDQEAEDIGYGETLTGNITTETYVKFYYFVGTQGDTISITMNTTQGDLDAIAYLYTFTSDNQPFLLVANDDSPLGGTYDPYIEYTLPRSGPYLVAITRYTDPNTQASTGNYEITLDLVTTPTDENAPAEDEVTSPETTPAG